MTKSWVSYVYTQLESINKNTKKEVEVKFQNLGYASYYEVLVDGSSVFSGAQEADPECEKLYWFILGIWISLTELKEK